MGTQVEAEGMHRGGDTTLLREVLWVLDGTIPVVTAMRCGQGPLATRRALRVERAH